MYIGRCLLSPAPIEGIHIGQNTTQALIPDVSGYQVVSSRQECLGMGDHACAGRTEVEQVHLFRQGEDGIHIAL